MNNKYCGKPTDFIPVAEDRSRIVFSYGMQPVEGKELVTWYQVEFYKAQGKPTLDAVKRAIIDDINARTDVWLSEENQRNFSEAQRLGLTPVKFKLSEADDGTPIYHTFKTAKELNAFYTQAATYIQQCLQDGWDEKDGIDFTPYEDYFNEKE